MYRNKNIKRTELSDLGEFGLIKRLTENLEIFNSSTLKGVGDDASVISNNGGEFLVSTDLLIEGIHFDLAYTPLKHLGYKAAVINFSDIAAMNAIPEQITVSIALSNRFSLEAVEELYEGIKLACNKYKVDLVGGDTSSSISGLFISITVIGRAKKEDITYRSGANINDLVLVSGDLGAAYFGLLLLKREKQVYQANPKIQPELVGYDYILQRQLKPEARTDIVKLLKEIDVKPTSMIDISDGLASEVLHICDASTKGVCIYEDKISINPETIKIADEFNIDPTLGALSGGEDYELLFTVSQKDFEKVKDQTDITIIGHITDASEGVNLISRSGSAVPITAQGWDAFMKNKG
ncbi:MAG: thiamine-phosphate kinase [Bacteroidetes bacterium]|nr:thiamine-phosphate kinase [Bacteroidota bacterium]